MAIGSTSKIIAATVTYPYQVIKTRLQQRNTPNNLIEDTAVIKSNHYSNTIDCMKQIWRYFEY